MKHFKIGFASMLLINIVFTQSLSAQSLQGHVMPIQEVQKQIESESFQRANNIREIQKLLQHSEVQNHFSGLYDLQKIEVALTNLDDTTLEDLAGRSRSLNDQLQAGISDIVAGVIVTVAVFFIIIIVIGSVAT